MWKWFALVGLTVALGTENLMAQSFGVFEQEKARYRALDNALKNTAMASSASPDFTVHYYRLEWEVDPEVRYIRGKVSSAFIITATTPNIRYDLSDSLRVDSVTYRGSRINHTRPGNNTLQVNFPSALNAGTRDSITIFYQGKPPENGYGSFSLSTHTGVPVMWTLSEPYGSRDWWPCRNGLDDKADSIDVIITTPDRYYGTSNGVLVSENMNGGKRTNHWKHRYPIVSYLVAIAATNYLVQQDTIHINGKILPLQQYVYPEAAAAWTASLSNTRNMMRYFEQQFGPYPFRNERYAHTQVGFGGGMEHQTNSFMGSTNRSLIAHELAHQWFGNRVTCGSWQDIWLNESFAIFGTYAYFETVLPPAETQNWFRTEVEIITSRPDGSVYVKDTSSIDAIFDYRTTYVKAGWVVNMLRWKLGDARFFAGVQQYLSDPKLSYGFARTEDLRRNLETASGQNLNEYFSDWVYGEGYPSYQLRWLPLGTKLQLSLNQTTSHPSVDFFEMPVPILFKNATRDTLLVINHTRNGQTELHELGFIPDTAIIDPYVKLISAKNSTSKSSGTTVKNAVKIYPNPIGDQFAILLNNFTSPAASVTIHNAKGQLMWKQDIPLPTGNDLLTIPSSTWSRGIYFVRVRSKDSNFVKTILK
jgi:aminopeptidase N